MSKDNKQEPQLLDLFNEQDLESRETAEKRLKAEEAERLRLEKQAQEELISSQRKILRLTPRQTHRKAMKRRFGSKWKW